VKTSVARYGIILVLVCLGTVLGFTSISKHKLTGDELLTLNTATGLGHSPLVNNTWVVTPIAPDKKVFTQQDYWSRNTLSNVLLNTSTYNGNMVAYNILLYYFIKLTHVDDGLLRGLSALFYVISILLVFLIAGKLFTDTKASVISAGLYALNPFVIHIGHDLRGYSFVTMIMLLSTLLLLNMDKLKLTTTMSKTARAVLLGLLYGLGFLSHYFAMYIILGHSLYLLYNYLVLKRNLLLQEFIALFICVLIFGLWYINGGKEGFVSMGIQDKFILSVTSPQTHTYFGSILMGTVCFINSVTGYYFQYLGYRNSSFFYVLVLPVAAIGMALFSSPLNKNEKNSLTFLGIMIVVCIVFLQLCSIKSGHVTSLIMTRFGAFIAPYFMILLGYSLSKLLFSNHNLFKIISIGILSAHVALNILCYQIPFGGYWFTYSDVKGDVVKARSEAVPPNPYPIIANTIMQQYSTGDTVVYNSFVTSQNVNLYLRDAKSPILQEVNLTQKEDYLIKYHPN
jgi:hypothetical protein